MYQKNKSLITNNEVIICHYWLSSEIPAVLLLIILRERLSSNGGDNPPKAELLEYTRPRRGSASLGDRSPGGTAPYIVIKFAVGFPYIAFEHVGSDDR